jgi:hypothetical protein
MFNKTKRLEERIKEQGYCVDRLFSRVSELEMAQNRLLAYLKIHEVTIPSTSCTKKFMTDEEYGEYSKTFKYSSQAAYGNSTVQDLLRWGL